MIHALGQTFAAMGTDAVLLVDAHNAFNRLNLRVALNNIQFVCPSLSTILIDMYHLPERMFVTVGIKLSSEEGTHKAAHRLWLCTLLVWCLSPQSVADRLQRIALQLGYRE